MTARPEVSPKLSIVMAVYNSERTLGESLESLAQQTFTDWELVVCDDGSTDGTRQLLTAFAESHGANRVRLLVNDTNRKLSFALNRCLDVATAEYIGRMDGDDISAPERFARQVAYLDEHRDIDLVGSTMRRFNSDGVGDIVRPASLAPTARTLASSSRSPFCHATVVARREVFESLGGYTDAWWTERAEDLDLWFRFMRAGFRGVSLDEPLYLVREDAAAIRRRTPRNRLAVFVTRVRGSWSLGLGPRSYLLGLFELLKILVPYRVFEWQRERRRRGVAGVDASTGSEGGAG